MAREGAEAKGRRYVSEARLVVEHVGGAEVRARCRGGGAIYRVGFKGGTWSCDCPAFAPRCAHLVALKLVTVAREAA